MLRDAFFAAMPRLLRPDSVLDCGKPNTWLVIMGERRNVGCPKGDAAPDAHTQRRLFAASGGYCQNPACAREGKVGGSHSRFPRPPRVRISQQAVLFFEQAFRQHSAVEDVRCVYDRLYRVHRRRGLAV
jgi:hypothetical protein